jgi:thiol-disulfide isomerase/thioredoxin
MRKIMKIIISYLLLLFLASCAPDKNEIINNFIKAVENKDIIQYSTTFTFNDISKGPTTIIGKCTIKLEPKDSLIGAYYNLKSNQNIYIYSGDEYLEYEPEYYGDSVIDVTSRSKESKDFTSEIVMKGQKVRTLPKPKCLAIYEATLAELIHNLNELKDTVPCKILTDTIIRGHDCRHLLFIDKDTIINNGKEYDSYTFDFDKKSNMLVYYRYYVTSQKMDATQETVIELDDFSFNNKDALKLLSRKAFLDGYKFIENAPRIKKKDVFLKKGTQAFTWELPSINDKVISLEELRVKPVFLIFSEIGCVPCMWAIPDLNDIAKEYKGMTILGIYPRDSKEELKKYAQKKEIAYDILYNSKDVATKYGVTGYPTYFLIDKKGIIRYSGCGYGEGMKKEWEKEIKKVLKN